jgi:hypothetical protein
MYVASLDVQRFKSEKLVVKPDPTTAPISQDSPKKDTQKTPESPSDYAIEIPKLTIKNTNISINFNEKPHSIEIKELELNNVELSEITQNLTVLLEGKINQSPIKIDTNISLTPQHGDIRATFSLTDFNLDNIQDFAQPSLQTIGGKLSLTSEIQVSLLDNYSTLNISLPTTDISLNKISLTTSTLTYASEQQFFNISDITIDKKNNTPITFKMGDISITQPTTIMLSDASVKPIFNQNFTFNNLTFGPINTREPLLASKFELNGTDTAYAKFDIKGWIMPLRDKLSLEVNANISEFSLPAISPYLAESLNLDLKTGQFDTKVFARIKNDMINGKSQVVIRGLELDKPDNSKAHALSDSKAFSLNFALGILQDDQGDIQLKIPFSGDVNAPDFGIQSFTNIVIKKSIMLTAKNYLVNAFVPFASVVQVVSVAGGYAFKVRLQPLIYAPKQTVLTSTQLKFLNELAALMNQSKKQHVKACVFSGISDLDVAIDIKDITNEQRKQLDDISLTRTNEVKQYLVKNKKIASSRILLCTRAINTNAKKQPRIEFSFE